MLYGDKRDSESWSGHSEEFQNICLSRYCSKPFSWSVTKFVEIVFKYFKYINISNLDLNHLLVKHPFANLTYIGHIVFELTLCFNLLNNLTLYFHYVIISGQLILSEGTFCLFFEFDLQLVILKKGFVMNYNLNNFVQSHEWVKFKRKSKNI